MGKGGDLLYTPKSPNPPASKTLPWQWCGIPIVLFFAAVVVVGNYEKIRLWPAMVGGRARRWGYSISTIPPMGYFYATLILVSVVGVGLFIWQLFKGRQ